MTWFDRSASLARRWWDRAARRHARRGSKIPEDDRSFFFLCDLLVQRWGGGSKDEQRGTILYFEMANSRRRNPPPRYGAGQSRQTRQSSRRDGGRALGRNDLASRSLSSGGPCADALVWPPPRLIRLRDSCMPWVGIGARFELSVRELTPIHEISEDSLPYSILGQRFITTLRPAASAFAAAASSRAPSCIQIIFGGGASSRASSTTGMMWLEFLKMSTMSMGRPISRSDATKGFPSRLLPR